MNVSWVTWEARRLGSDLCSLPPHSWHQMSTASGKGYGRMGRLGAIPRWAVEGEGEFGWELEGRMILMQVEESKLVLGYG